MTALFALGPHLPLLVVIVPLVGALLAALVRHPVAAWAIALAAGVVNLGLAVMLLIALDFFGSLSYRLGGFAPELGIEYRVDAVSFIPVLLIAFVGLATAIYARQSVAAEVVPERVGYFYALLLLCQAGLLGMAVTGDAFNVFVFLEISSLATYGLIALGRDRRALVAAYQYLIVGTVGATLYVIGVGLLYLTTGSLNLGIIVSRLGDVASPRALTAAEAFILIGLALKLALFPLHAWLPNAYAHAPSAATSFLASTATKVAIYLFARYLFGVFGGHGYHAPVPVLPVLMALSLAAMFFPSASAVYQNDIKRLLAFSSVGQIGYITLGLALANPTGVAAGFLHLINHALMKGAAFMAIGAVLYRTGSTRLDELAGIGRTMPFTAAALTIAGLGLIGVPGTSGFVSKWYLVLAAFDAGMGWLAILVVASSVIAVLYVGRIVEVVWFREPARLALAAREAPLELLVPTLVLAALTIWFGLQATWPAELAAAAARVLVGDAS